MSRAVLVLALAGASGAAAWLAGIGAPYHTVAAACTSTSHNGFTSASADGLTLGGSATITGSNALRLTSSQNNTLGTAWSTSQVSLLGDASFSTSFTLKFSNPSAFGPGADGMVFALQTLSNTAGGVGGGLGIQGVSPSIAVEFDDFKNTDRSDPDNHHMAIDLNGNVDHTGVPSGRIFSTSTSFFGAAPITSASQASWYVWVDYNGATTTFEARIAAASAPVANIPPTSSRPASAQVSIVDNLATRLGQTTAFVGFTSATGGANATHEVLGWRFFPCYNPNPDGTAQSITFNALSDRTLADASSFTVSATATSNLAVSFSSATTSVCTVSGTTVTVLTSGTCSVIASQPGDSTFAAADPVTRSFTVSKASQTITFAALGGRLIAESPFTLSATASSGLAVSFASSTTSVCTVSGTTVTLVAVGTCTITASQAGDPTYAAATDVDRSFTASPTPVAQIINFGPLRDRTMLEQPFTLSANVSSGFTVSFASATPSVCAVSGDVVTLVATGKCTITASAPGSPGGYPFTAALASASFDVTKAPQSIVFAAPSGRTIDALPFTVSATASSGLAVSFASSTAGVCTVSGSTVTLLAVGTCTLTASQAGDPTYAAADPVTRSFAVAKLAQAITFAAPSNRTLADASPFSADATASSGLGVAFTSATPSVCTASGATVTVVGAGSCTLTASQPGDSVYAAAPSVTRSFAVTKAPQSISFAALTDRDPAQSPFTVSATASSGLAVRFVSSTASVCTVSGTGVTLVGEGTCAITASQAGDERYSAAADVTQRFTVAKLAQSMDFAVLADRTLLDPTSFQVSATASSGLRVTFTSATPDVCTVLGDVVTVLKDGTCTITASSAGSLAYLPGSISRSFAVTRAAQSIAFARPADRTLLDPSSFTVSASATSDLPVSLTSTTLSVCTVSGTTVTVFAAGVCTITASQPGDSRYAAAAPVTRSFAVTRVPQSIDAISGIDVKVDHLVGERAATLAGTASSGLPVAFSASGACALTGAVLSFPTEGDCTLTALQAGNATYLPAASRVFTFKVKVIRSPVAVVVPVAPGGAPVPTRQSACGPIPAPDVATYVGLRGYHSAWAGESPFLVAAPGQPLEYCLVLRNTGTLPWVSGERSTQINLGSNTPQDSTAYVDEGLIVSELYNRNRFSTAQEATVMPGDYATFVIRVRALITPGITRLDMAPVIDGVQWLEDEGIYFLIAVR